MLGLSRTVAEAMMFQLVVFTVKGARKGEAEEGEKTRGKSNSESWGATSFNSCPSMLYTGAIFFSLHDTNNSEGQIMRTKMLQRQALSRQDPTHPSIRLQ
jgi:hypothetical protein